MKIFSGKLILIIIVIIVIIASYLLLSANQQDTTPPIIQSITGNMTAYSGTVVTIFANFSDNVNVTYATIYYKSDLQNEWANKSILTGSADLFIPFNSSQKVMYYIVVDDEAGNGPIGSPSLDGSVSYIITILESPDNENETTETRYVFIEAGTATNCVYCPIVEGIINELYESGKYDFYYVSLVTDTTSDAKKRMETDYNIVENPNVFIDGGYRVLVGSTHDTAEYVKAIQESHLRVTPQVDITVAALYDNTSEELNTEVTVQNKESSIYNAQLRVYLVEIVSQLRNYNQKPYHYGFVGFLFDNTISLTAGEEKLVTVTKDISTYDPDNLMIISVLFNSASELKYAKPPDQYQFNAHYVDAVATVSVGESDNTPPIVSITIPEYGRIHLMGNPIFTSTYPLKNTFLFGATIVEVTAEDESGISRVEFYLDGEFQANDTTPPYQWEINLGNVFKEFFFHKHTINVIAYDATGKKSEDSRIVWMRLK